MLYLVIETVLAVRDAKTHKLRRFLSGDAPAYSPQVGNGGWESVEKLRNGLRGRWRSANVVEYVPDGVKITPPKGTQVYEFQIVRLLELPGREADLVSWHNYLPEAPAENCGGSTTSTKREGT